MKKLYKVKLGLLVLLSSLSFGELFGHFVSNPVTGNYEDASSWVGTKAPAGGNDYRALTIVEDAHITKNGNFTGKAAVSVNGTFIVNGDYKSGYGGTTVNGSLIVSETFSGNLTVSAGATVRANSFTDGNTTVNGSLVAETFNGNLIVGPGATVRVKSFTGGTFDVKSGGTLIIEDGDCTLTNQSYIRSQGKVEIYGDFILKSNISIEPTGILVVYGNFVANGNWGMNISGNIVVSGDFSASNGTIQNNGNVVIGGDFTHGGGGFGGTNENNFYLINPDAEINAPGWTSVGTGGYGNLEAFENNEEDNEDLLDIVGQALPQFIQRDIIWKGSQDSNWFNSDNWKGSVPKITSSVIIRGAEADDYYDPNISGTDFVEVGKLSIESGAVLTLKPGAKLTVNGILTIEEEGGLVMENTTEINGLSSLITNGDVVGKARINLEFPRDEWYYVSQPIKEAKSDIYALLDDNGTFRRSEAWVNIHRANRWYRIAGGVAIAELEGLSIKYRVADENDEANHLVTYTGELNNGSISRTFANAQYYLFGNPYPSSINWQDDTGWSRNNIGGTIYYRARVNGSMTFVTYNRFAAVAAARAAVFPDGVEDGDVAELAIIPPLQSVWIASLGEGSITIDNNARQHVAAGSLLKSARGSSNSSVIRIGVSNESGADGAVLYFSENSDEGLDLGDSEKMFNDAEGIPEVFTRVGDRSMAINGLPLLENDTSSISLSVRNKTLGEVNLKFDLSAFASDYVPVLEDKLANVFVDITQTNIYTYSVVEVGTNHDRFVIHLNYQPVVDDQEEIVEEELESEEPEISDDEDVVDAGDGSSIDNEDVTDGENGDDSEALESDGSDTDIEEGASEDSDENLSTDQSDSQSKEETDYGVSTSLQDQQQDAADAQNAISIKSIAGKVLISVDVEMLQSGPGIVEIYSIEGRKISEVPARSSRTLVFLPSQSGIYVVRAIFGNIVKSERVMVKS